MANVNIRVDDALKRDVEMVLADIGLSLSAATNLYYRQIIKKNSIPFELKADPFYSAENMAELSRRIADFESGKVKPIIKTMAELEEMADE